MIEIVNRDKNTNLPLWIDVLDPTIEELNSLQVSYGLHFTWVHDCMEAGHLPKYEKIKDTTFIIVRSFDELSHESDDNVQKITRKVSLFLGNRFLITIHRQAIPFLEEIKDKYKDKDEVFLQIIMLEILLESVESYHAILEAAELRVQEFEKDVLSSDINKTEWIHIFQTKCRLSVTKRMLWHSLNTVQKFVPSSSANMPICQDIRERIENLQFFSDGLLDDLNYIQSIQQSLTSNSLNRSSHKTNEVMRLLTVFSLFFLPINFIVGVYGMNFENMPELKSEYGYPMVLLFIVLIELAIYFWFRKKGWMSSEKL